MKENKNKNERNEIHEIIEIIETMVRDSTEVLIIGRRLLWKLLGRFV